MNISKIILYLITYSLIFIPLSNIIQSVLAGISTRTLGTKALQASSFVGAIIFWLIWERLWIILVGIKIPNLLLMSMYIFTAFFTKNQRSQMNLLFRTNKQNETYVLLILLIHHMFFINNAWF